MTMLQQGSGTAHALAADWRLDRFRSDGVTACCPADMAIHLAIDGRGRAHVQCGPVRSDGRVTITGQRLVFADMVVVAAPWGPVPTALEDRVAAALEGEFAVALEQGRMTLHRPAATLEFSQLG